MMPYCAYKRCKRVADTSLGFIAVGKVTGDTIGDRPYAETVYVCDKHLHKIIKSLGFKEKKS